MSSSLAPLPQSRDNASVIVLASQSWDSHWCTPQQIASRLSEFCHVLYVEPPRSPLWRLRGLATHSQRRAGVHRVGPQLTVLALPAVTLPIHAFSRLPFLRRMNNWLLSRWVRRHAHALGMTSSVVWAYQITWQGSSLVREAALSVYDCIDDWPGGAGSAHYRRYYAQLDAALCQEVDVLFVGSRQLADTRKALNERSSLVPQGVDLATFLPPAEGFVVPAVLQALPGPRIGLAGVLNAERLDVALICHLADARPKWSIVLIGPVWKGLDEPRLRQRPNIHLLGNQPRESLGAFLAGLDVCMLPYLLNDFTRAIFPLKLFEYLASGKPFVSTPIPACEEFGELIRTAATPEAFLEAVEAGLAEQGQSAVHRRQAVAKENDWGQRTAEKWRAVCAATVGRSARPKNEPTKRLEVTESKA